MIGNIIILGLAIGIIWYVVKVFRSDLAGKPFNLLSGIVFSLILVFSIFIPNIDFIKSPLTPTIHCKVVDAETNTPIPNAVVLLDWGYEISSFPYHYYGVSTKQQILITDKNGEFNADSKWRFLAINMSIIYKRDNGGVGAVVIKNGYKHVDYSFDGRTNQIIKLNKIITGQDKRIEKNNLLTIREMAKRRYIKSIADYIEQIVDSLSRQLYLEGAQ